MGFDSCLLLSEISYPLFLEGKGGQDSLSNLEVLESLFLLFHKIFNLL